MESKRTRELWRGCSQQGKVHWGRFRPLRPAQCPSRADTRVATYIRVNGDDATVRRRPTRKNLCQEFHNVFRKLSCPCSRSSC